MAHDGYGRLVGARLRALVGLLRRTMPQGKLTQAEAARLLGIEFETFTKWLGGRVVPSEQNRRKLCEGLRVLLQPVAEPLLWKLAFEIDRPGHEYGDLLLEAEKALSLPKAVAALGVPPTPLQVGLCIVEAMAGAGGGKWATWRDEGAPHAKLPPVDPRVGLRGRPVSGAELSMLPGLAWPIFQSQSPQALASTVLVSAESRSGCPMTYPIRVFHYVPQGAQRDPAGEAQRLLESASGPLKNLFKPRLHHMTVPTIQTHPAARVPTPLFEVKPPWRQFKVPRWVVPVELRLEIQVGE